MAKNVACVAPRQYRIIVDGMLPSVLVPTVPSLRDVSTRDAVLALAAGDHDDTPAGVDRQLDKLFTDGADKIRLARLVIALFQADHREPTPFNLEVLASLAWLDGEPRACANLVSMIGARHGLPALLGSPIAMYLLHAVHKGVPAPGIAERVIEEAEHLLES